MFVMLGPCYLSDPCNPSEGPFEGKLKRKYVSVPLSSPQQHFLKFYQKQRIIYRPVNISNRIANGSYMYICELDGKSDIEWLKGFEGIVAAFRRKVKKECNALVYSQNTSYWLVWTRSFTDSKRFWTQCLLLPCRLSPLCKIYAKCMHNTKWQRVKLPNLGQGC